jgi:hypothetical protein
MECHSIDDDGGITGRPLGEHPRGLVICTPGGSTSGQLAATSRPVVDSADPLGGPPDQRAATYPTYLAYWGRYAIDGDRIIHHADSGLAPAGLA